MDIHIHGNPGNISTNFITELHSIVVPLSAETNYSCVIVYLLTCSTIPAQLSHNGDCVKVYILKLVHTYIRLLRLVLRLQRTYMMYSAEPR